MIEIDGSLGEGGGQIIRTSVAFGAVMQESVRIINIRAKRENPGLRAQHINAIKAVAELCNAATKGIEIGSKEIEFIPSEIKARRLNIDIGTAGSITLVLQALMIPAIYTKEILEIKIRGGTDVRLSPSIDYLRFVTIPILRKFGYNAEIELVRRGYYPAGNGLIVAKIHPVEKLKSINLIERGKIVSINGISHAHQGLESSKVAERQANSARLEIFNKLHMESEIQKGYVDALSYGSGITLYAETENVAERLRRSDICLRGMWLNLKGSDTHSRLRLGCVASQPHSVLGSGSLGERGKRAEIVGTEAASNLIKEIISNAPIDRHMADQIIPYLAIAGGSVRVSEITEHAKTNVEIVNRFGFNLKIDGNIISC